MVLLSIYCVGILARVMVCIVTQGGVKLVN